MSTDDAYVEADKVGVSTDVSGIVKEVDVDGEPAGQAGPGPVPPRRSPVPARARARHRAARDGRGTISTRSRRTTGTCRRRSSRRRTISTITHRNCAAQQDLAGAHFASQPTFDTARPESAERAAEARLAQPAAGGDRRQSQRRSRGPVEQNPRYLDAVAQRDEAARQLDHTVVKAPFAGIVTNVPSIAPGKYLAASTTAFYLVATDHVWVDANPKETELTYVRPGQPVTVTVDTYPDVEWRGTVAEHQPGGGAGVLAPAGAEHQRQLGEGGAAHPDARARRHERQESAAAARRDERRGRCRYRSRARLAALPDRACSATPRRGA